MQVDRAGWEKGHCGEHINTLRCFARKPEELWKWSKLFRREVYFKSDPRVVLCDYAGKCRSVLLCRFFIHLARSYGFHAVGPWHLQKHRWEVDGDACCDCRGCDVENPDKAGIFPAWVSSIEPLI